MFPQTGWQHQTAIAGPEQDLLLIRVHKVPRHTLQPQLPQRAKLPESWNEVPEAVDTSEEILIKSAEDMQASAALGLYSVAGVQDFSNSWAAEWAPRLAREASDSCADAQTSPCDGASGGLMTRKLLRRKGLCSRLRACAAAELACMLGAIS